MNMKNKIKQTARLTINQDMTMINAAGIKDKMEDALNSASTLNLILKNIEVIDLAGMQLIYAIKKEAENQNKNVKINFDVKADLVESIRLAGFDDLLKN